MGITRDRIGVTMLTAITNVLWGVRANLVADVVSEQGSVRALIWFGRNMPRYEWTLARWGPIRTHLVSAVVSLDNGCSYATHGHAHAFQLHYFNDTGRLFPLSDEEVLQLNDTDRAALVATMRQALERADLDNEWDWIVRALQIKDGAAVDRPGDRNLRHLATMFEWLNACGMRAGTELDGAHDPINKNTELRARYASARAATTT